MMINRVTGSSIFTWSIRALVERKEIGVLSGKLRGHAGLKLVYAEERKDPGVEAEAEFTWITVIHPLALCVVKALARELVLEFKGEYGDAVDSKHEVYGLLVVSGVVPLSVTFNNVLSVQFCVKLVKF